MNPGIQLHGIQLYGKQLEWQNTLALQAYLAIDRLVGESAVRKEVEMKHAKHWVMVWSVEWTQSGAKDRRPVT